jgi:hypothetical protein
MIGLSGYVITGHDYIWEYVYSMWNTNIIKVTS